MRTARFAASVAIAATIVGLSPAVVDDPTPGTSFRIVTMEGQRSLAYYSVVERRYRFLGDPALQASADAAETVPADASQSN